MTAALYTAMCVALAPISYGAVQIRVAEALTLLPVISPVFIIGVTVGCLLSNIVGLMTGANIIGVMDIVFGTAATFAAAVLTYKLRKIKIGKIPVLAALPPVIINAVVIGAELMFVEAGGFNLKLFLFNASYVGLGQTAACFLVGLPLVYFLPKALRVEGL